MMSGGQLNLQKQDFLNAFAESLQNLRRSDELFDVTLACEDETIEAHKFVLSSNSAFFKEVFKKARKSNPFVYLKGIRHKDLMALLDYMYTGETEVPTENLSRVFQVAKDLKIKGLVDDEENIEGFTLKYDDSETAAEETENTTSSAENALQLESHLLNDPLSEETKNTIDTETTIVEVDEADAKLAQLKESISLLVQKVQDENGVKKFRCKQCGKICMKKDKIENHVETHLTGFINTCSICNQNYKTRSGLRSHELTIHRDVIEKGNASKNKLSIIKIEENEKPPLLSDEAKKIQNISKRRSESPEELEELKGEIIKRLMKVENEDGSGSVWQCLECSKQMKKRDKLEYHIETHLEGFTHTCVECSRVHKTRGALIAHFSISHRQETE